MPNDKDFELDDLDSFSLEDLSLDDAPEGPGSTKAEDPFGVWVKSAPEDLDVAPPSAAAPGLPEEDFLSTEELANLDDTFEFVTVEEPLPGEDPLESDGLSVDEGLFLDTREDVDKADSADALGALDEISLDDFVSFDEADSGTEAPVAPPRTGVDLGLEDDLNEEFLDIDIDIDDEVDDAELEIAPEAPAKSGAKASSGDHIIAQDVDLAEFGDFEEVAPAASSPLGRRESVAPVPDVPDIEDLPPASAPPKKPLDDDELPVFDDLEDDFLGETDDGFFEEEILEETSKHLVDEGPVNLDLEPDDQTDLDHLRALEEDLTSGIRKPAAEAAPTPGPDLATLILGKIEQELSSIKQEIADLKSEVTQMRVPARAEAPVQEPGAPERPLVPAPEEEPAPALSPKSHGFFDEEDDETIALTGDELDNILSTAEISEGEDPGITPDEDLLSLDEEGNLLEPSSIELQTPAPEGEVHVTDEEFFAGTTLADEPLDLEIPASVELEEGLPLDLDESETEDLLSESVDFEAVPEVVDEASEDVELELVDNNALAPDLAAPLPAPELSVPELPEPEVLADTEGWSPPEDWDQAPLPEPPAVVPPAVPTPSPAGGSGSGMSPGLKDELRAVLSYMDKLLASLPDDKIQEFAESEHFEVYKRLFEELGLIE